MSDDAELARRLSQVREQSGVEDRATEGLTLRDVGRRILDRAQAGGIRRARPVACVDCRDTGYVLVGDGVRRCLACRPPVEKALDAAGVPTAKQAARLDSGIREENLDIAFMVRGLIESGFSRGGGEAWHGAFFCGEHGLGKTWIACAAAAYAYGLGWSVLFVTARDLLDEIRGVYQREDSGAVMDIQARYRAPRLLVLNELPRGRGGKDRATRPEPVSGFEAEQIESLLNYRGDEHGGRLKTIVTGNMSSDDIGDLYNAALASRMGERCYLRVPFGGADQRGRRR